MNDDLHSAAGRLILKDRIEGLSPQERLELDAHLENCAACASLAESTRHALRELSCATVALPPALADRTRLRVYMRARERETRGWALWILCGLSWALGIATAPHVWRAFEWLGRSTGAPAAIWQMGFGLWWAVPALFAAAVLLIERAGRREIRD
ncbi:MAG TPA: zf-HC2 domain-containing protein [Bryobacteraceae bacterium]|nr:zf-HC2 domain-containing protein [Bryobacteraceae bacterium]